MVKPDANELMSWTEICVIMRWRFNSHWGWTEIVIMWLMVAKMSKKILEIWKTYWNRNGSRHLPSNTQVALSCVNWSAGLKRCVILTVQSLHRFTIHVQCRLVLGHPDWHFMPRLIKKLEKIQFLQNLVLALLYQFLHSPQCVQKWKSVNCHRHLAVPVANLTLTDRWWHSTGSAHTSL